MRGKMIPLTRMQKEIMREFYTFSPTKVIYDKCKRKQLWKQAVSNEKMDLTEIEKDCPAFAHQIKRSKEQGHLIQSAVFSECVYAQTLANMFNLSVFVNCAENSSYIPPKIVSLLVSYHLVPRYVYSSKDKSRMLIQAGGCGGIDSALITVFDLTIFTIEFKEPGAKTSEPDLPKYGEDGLLQMTEQFKQNYPQFIQKKKKKTGLNFFNFMGNNIHDFSSDSVHVAVSNNYTKKYADVVCTEDKDGYLVMLPANQISCWADIEGEIRPAGRNHYNVWTPKALRKFLEQKNAVISENGIITIPKKSLTVRKARGGNGSVSGYKINPLFFVYTVHCVDKGDSLSFPLEKVQQLNPTIAGKMFFSGLEYAKVFSYYQNQLQ